MWMNEWMNSWIHFYKYVCGEAGDRFQCESKLFQFQKGLNMHKGWLMVWPESHWYWSIYMKEIGLGILSELWWRVTILSIPSFIYIFIQQTIFEQLLLVSRCSRHWNSSRNSYPIGNIYNKLINKIYNSWWGLFHWNK